MTPNEVEKKLNIKVDMVPAGSKNRPGRTLNATYVTIHNTANASKGANAAMHARYVKGSDAMQRKVSWHYTVDDKECYKHLPLSEQGYHAGTAQGNAKSVGIEICMNSDSDQAKANDRAALLAAYICSALHIPTDNIVPHKHWSGKNCPALLLKNNGAGWKAFIKQAKALHAQITKKAPVTALRGERARTVSPQLRPEKMVATPDTGRLAKIKTKEGLFITNARPDTPDFRDRMYISTLVEVPPHRTLGLYAKEKVPILDQGQEGACTGFALATVVNYLRKVNRKDAKRIASPWMMYEMAKKYDEWPGEQYSGSSARGAMKAWHKHGVCSLSNWDKGDRVFTEQRAKDATARPLGAYFRVNHKDLVAMHTAITEVGILYATASVHSGWGAPDPKTGKIEYVDGVEGGHAFVIVGYDAQGFWIQNSWGPEWGKNGYAHVSYEDWLNNGSDVWVARLGVPIQLDDVLTANSSRSSSKGHYEGYASAQLRKYIVSLGNDGQLSSTGTYGTDIDDLDQIVAHFVATTKDWKKRRILLFAHGGLVEESVAVGHIAKHADWLIKHEVYPVSFIWHSGFLDTIKNVIEDALRRRRPEGFLDKTLDFMKDRLDDMLEPIARAPGKLIWDEMKENAKAATLARDGGARLFLERLAKEAGRLEVEVHLAGHSAGSEFHAPLVKLAATPLGQVIPGWPEDGNTGLGFKVATCTLWAPACRIEVFKDAYLPLLKSGHIGKLAVFALTDRAEKDDQCMNIYNKSLLYLVSNALENPFRIPVIRPDGAPILGMQKFIEADKELNALFEKGDADLVLSPSSKGAKPGWVSQATSHGGFDDDTNTLLSTFERIIGPSVRDSAAAPNKRAATKRRASGRSVRPDAKKPRAKKATRKVTRKK
ncbi:MAG: N-acetylmuramoyl-L-alanine amidase [Fimbriimonadaceae bacterium]